MAVANKDKERLTAWFSMYKDQALANGKTVGEMSIINMDDYIANADQKYQEVDKEFEAVSTTPNWSDSVGKENCEQFVALNNDPDYTKISINKESLVDKMAVSGVHEEMRKEGYFVSRIPGTYGENRKYNMDELERQLLSKVAEKSPVKPKYITIEADTPIQFLKGDDRKKLCSKHKKMNIPLYMIWMMKINFFTLIGISKKKAKRILKKSIKQH